MDRGREKSSKSFWISSEWPHFVGRTSKTTFFGGYLSRGYLLRGYLFQATSNDASVHRLPVYLAARVAWIARNVARFSKKIFFLPSKIMTDGVYKFNSRKITQTIFKNLPNFGPFKVREKLEALERWKPTVELLSLETLLKGSPCDWLNFVSKPSWRG